MKITTPPLQSGLQLHLKLLIPLFLGLSLVPYPGNTLRTTKGMRGRYAPLISTAGPEHQNRTE